MVIRLKNEIGMVKDCKIGFSWTTLFFCFFPALFRGDWKWAFIQFGCASITFGLSSLVFCFIYNRLYINDLLNKGFSPITESDKAILISKNFLASDI